jgi:integrase/recombinase XerC
MLNLYRRHLQKCPHRAKGTEYTKCSCPIWCDGELNGRRYRRSLDLRDWQRAIRKVTALEQPGARQPKNISVAVEAFHSSRQDLARATKAKYERVLRYLQELATTRGLHEVDQFTVEDIDALRSFRTTSAVTWVKYLEILRQFFQFCLVRKWIEDNPAACVERPKNLKPNDVEPYSREEVVRILAACEDIGRGPYERLRARAIMLLLRYTALRIGDVATLEKARVRDGAINVRTTKSGAVVWLPLHPEPLHPEVQAALAVLPAPRGPEGGKYFFWTGNGSPDSMVRAAERTLKTVFNRSEVPRAHAHRFRHTLATELLEQGWTYEDVADVLGNSAAIVRKHYAKWSRGRQDRITEMMRSVFAVQNWYTPEKQPITPIN